MSFHPKWTTQMSVLIHPEMPLCSLCVQIAILLYLFTKFLYWKFIPIILFDFDKRKKRKPTLVLQQESAVKVFRMTDCLFNCLDKFGSSKQSKNYLHKQGFKSNPWLRFGYDDRAGRSNRNQEASLLSFKKKTVVFLHARWLSFLAYSYPDKDTRSLCVSTTMPGASVFSNNYCLFSFHKILLFK